MSLGSGEREGGRTALACKGARQPFGPSVLELATTVASMSNEEMEVELLLRVVEPQGRSDRPGNQLWQINLTVGIYCECWTNHGTHYVRDMRWQAASPAGLRNAVGEIVDIVERWREQRRDAAWWRDYAGLPARAAGG